MKPYKSLFKEMAREAISAKAATVNKSDEIEKALDAFLEKKDHPDATQFEFHPKASDGEMQSFVDEKAEAYRKAGWEITHSDRRLRIKKIPNREVVYESLFKESPVMAKSPMGTHLNDAAISFDWQELVDTVYSNLPKEQITRENVMKTFREIVNAQVADAVHTLRNEMMDQIIEAAMQE